MLSTFCMMVQPMSRTVRSTFFNCSPSQIIQLTERKDNKLKLLPHTSQEIVYCIAWDISNLHLDEQWRIKDFGKGRMKKVLIFLKNLFFWRGGWTPHMPLMLYNVVTLQGEHRHIENGSLKGVTHGLSQWMFYNTFFTFSSAEFRLIHGSFKNLITINLYSSFFKVNIPLSEEDARLFNTEDDWNR